MRMSTTPRREKMRDPRTLAAALIAASLLAGCGSGGSGGGREGAEGAATSPNTATIPSLKQREAASIKREQGELVALKRSQQRARVAREAAEAEAAKKPSKKTTAGKSTTTKTKTTNTKATKSKGSGSEKKKGSGTEAERAARKRFEEEEAREAGK